MVEAAAVRRGVGAVLSLVFLACGAWGLPASAEGRAATAAAPPPEAPGAPADTPGPVVTFGSGMTSVVPARVLDTREGIGAPKAKVGPAGIVALTVNGKGGLPATGVGTVVLNVTATNATAATHVSLWPAGAANPGTSNLNVTAGQTVPNLVSVKVGKAGVVNVYNNAGSVHLIADIMGWFPDSAAINSVVPARILDTRDGTGRPSPGKVGPGQSIPVVVAGRGGVPASGVGAVVLNVTATNPTASSHLSLWPAGGANPGTSNLNFQPDQTVPNLVVVAVGALGTVTAFNNAGQTHVIVDVMGWFSDVSDVAPIVPARIFDTRDGIGRPAPGKIGPGQTVPVTIDGRGGLPADGVGTVILNVTATNPTASSHLTLWPKGADNPGTSNLNVVADQTVPNLVAVKVGTGGVVNLFNNAGNVHVIADVMAWFPEPIVGQGAKVQPFVDTVLLGSGDVVSETGDPATGGTVRLSRSADVPVAGGQFSVFPGPGAPDGLMGKVTATAVQPDGTTIVTYGPTTFEDVFADFEITFDGPLPVPTSGTGNRLVPGADLLGGPGAAGGGPAVGGGLSFIKDWGDGRECSAGGEIGATDWSFDASNPRAYATFKPFKKQVAFQLGFDATVDFTASSTVAASCSLDIDLPIKWIVYGIVIEPKVHLEVEISASINTEYSITAPVTLGFAIGDEEINESETPFSGTAQFQGVSGQVAATVGILLEVKFLKIVGVTGLFGLKATLAIDDSKLPCQTLTIGPTVQFGVELDLVLKNWHADVATFEPDPWVIWSSHPPVCPALQKDYWAGTITYRVELHNDQLGPTSGTNYDRSWEYTYHFDRPRHPGEPQPPGVYQSAGPVVGGGTTETTERFYHPGCGVGAEMSEYHDFTTNTAKGLVPASLSVLDTGPTLTLTLDHADLAEISSQRQSVCYGDSDGTFTADVPQQFILFDLAIADPGNVITEHIVLDRSDACTGACYEEWTIALSRQTG